MGQGASRGHPASTWWTRGLRVPWWWQQHPRGLSAEPGGGGNRARRRERVSARPVACALPRTAGDAARLGTHVSQETSLQAGAVPATRGKELRRGPEEPRPAQGQQPAPRTPPGLGFRRRHAGPQGVLASRAPGGNREHAWKGRRPRTPPPLPGARGAQRPLGRPQGQVALCLRLREAQPRRRGGWRSGHAGPVALRAAVPPRGHRPTRTRSPQLLPPLRARVPGRGCGARLRLRGHAPCPTSVYPLLSSETCWVSGRPGHPESCPLCVELSAREDPTSKDAPL